MRVSYTDRKRTVTVAVLLAISPVVAFGQSDRGSNTTAGEYRAVENDESFSATGRTGYSASHPYGSDAGNEHLYAPTYVAGGSYRQPTSIEFLDSATALITTKQTGQVFRLQLPDHRLSLVYHDQTASWGQVVKLAADVVAIAEHNRSQVVIFQFRQDTWQIVCCLDAPGLPSSLVWDNVSGELLASGRWSRRLYRWKLIDDAPAEKKFSKWTTRKHVDLPMCGGQVLILRQHDSILVVDAFGREYVVIGKSDFQLKHRSQLYGHNVTGLLATPDEDMVYFPHQLINEYARAVRTDITWGGMISNNIRWLRTDRLLHKTGHDVFRKGKFYPLGTTGNGAGDPSSIAVSSRGRIAVTLGGTSRVTIGRKDDYYFRQVDVGYRPVDCVYTPDETELLVVNQFSDSISIVDLSNMTVRHVSLGAVREPTSKERGEQLFFSSQLSHDGWMSCHSCHSEGHTSGQLNDNFTDRSFGTPKRILSLLGQAGTMPYSWGGGIETLEEQVALSIESTMASNDDVDDKTMSAIATFIRSLPAPPSVLAARRPVERTREALSDNAIGNVDDDSISVDIEHGRTLFRQLNCNDCHSGKRMTSRDTFDVGLRDEQDMSQFNPPSLVSLSQRQNALLHDARATSIRDVVVKEKHQLPRKLSHTEQQELVRFLESL